MSDNHVVLFTFTSEMVDFSALLSRTLAEVLIYIYKLNSNMNRFQLCSFTCENGVKLM